MLWETDTGKEDMRCIHDHMLARKRDLPAYAESNNPPTEYLFDGEEMREWHKFKDEPPRRKLVFVPQKLKSLREVPWHPRCIYKRFLRCLDLYLCQSALRMMINFDTEYLISEWPSPIDLQPSPTTGHTDVVRTVTIKPQGEYNASESDDKAVQSKSKYF